MNRAWLVSVGVLAATGCGGVMVAVEDDGGAGGGSASAGGGGGAGWLDGGFDGLTCDVATLLAQKCSTCHGATLAPGVPWPITSRAQLMDLAPGWAVTKAERSIARMTAQTMPPSGGNTSAEIAVLQNWVTAGMRAGTCETVDAGPAPTTCASGSKWSRGNSESPEMNPGLACVNCHKTMASDKAFYFMGTAFPSAHEQDTCNPKPPSSLGLVVEILDASGRVVLTLPVGWTSGNFYSRSRSAGLTLPYTARVKNAAGRTTVMTTPQTNGDCNSCHTEQGTSGAPGRITWPQ